METMNATDRRINQARAIVYRDEFLDTAAAAVRGELPLQAVVDFHGELQSFLDGVLMTRFPGVAARLRQGLADIGWTFARGEVARAEYNAQTRAANAPGATCGKCDGHGKLNAFGHVANGVCFSCGGSGKVR